MHDQLDMPPDASFGTRVVALVHAIPHGRVATYGQIAGLAGRPRAARLIGGILRHAAEDVPWHRVVNVRGGISTYKLGVGDLQVALLRSEGVEVLDGQLELERYRWRPEIGGGSGGAWIGSGGRSVPVEEGAASRSRAAADEGAAPQDSRHVPAGDGEAPG